MKPIYKIMFTISISLVIAAIVTVIAIGLNLGVDFKGGSVIELTFNQRPPIQEIQNSLASSLTNNAKDIYINPEGDKGVIIKSVELPESTHQTILSNLKTQFPSAGLDEKRFDSIGPVIGNELKQKSIIAIILVLLGIIVYIAIVFRKLSRSLSPWAMGLSAIIALIHDVTIPIGVFAILSKYYGIEISAVFVAAALTILGYSVSDTVVIFDRVRENIVRRNTGESFAAIVHKSIMQTLTRSLNTTFTTLLSLLAIYFFGGESIKYFSLALILGIFLGAYSSIFVASPLLVWWSKK